MPIGPNAGVFIALAIALAITIAWRVTQISMGW